MKNDLTERLAATVYKQGEAKQKAGDGAGAVDDFLRVARVAPDSKIKSTAEYDAAAQLINLKQWDRAITVLEQFRKQYPKSELSADVTRKLAVAYTEAHRPGEAAAEFEAIAANPGRGSRRCSARRCCSRRICIRRPTTRRRRCRCWRSSLPRIRLRCRMRKRRAQRLADYAAKTGDIGKRDYWYREIIKADAQAGAQRTDRTHYLAAKAQLALAQPARDAFRAVRLTAPLKKSLVAKRKALEDAMNGYKKAAEYNVAEVTTAATFEMAELYRTLSKDVMSSERPKNIKGDELEEYNSLLEEQVFPFEEQAIKAHEINTARAKDGVYDEWVQKSFKVLAELKPARYGKTEITQDVATTLN